MKKNVIVSVYVLFISVLLMGQYPAPLNESNFPKANDSIEIRAFSIPATQNFTPNNPIDSLTLERTLQKAIEANNALDPMVTVNNGGFRRDTIATFFYQAFAKPPYKRKYQAFSPYFPGAANFVGANLYCVIPTSEGDAHTYFKKDNTGFYELGFYSVTSQGAMTVKHTPEKPIAKFPVDYANSMNVPTMNISTLAQSSNSSVQIFTKLTITVDAYGDVTIVDGSISNPVYTTYTNFLRLSTLSIDTMNLGGGMQYYVKAKIYSYYVAGVFEPVAVYSVAQIRSNIDTMFWQYGIGKWYDEIEFSYVKPYQTSQVQDLEASTFSIFPNPTDGRISLNFAGMPEEFIIVDVYDVNGRFLGRFGKQNSGIVDIDISNEEPGVYILNIKFKERTYPVRILKQ